MSWTWNKTLKASLPKTGCYFCQGQQMPAHIKRFLKAENSIIKLLDDCLWLKWFSKNQAVTFLLCSVVIFLFIILKTKHKLAESLLD